ncbi:MAG TPA: arginine deiminase family protein, partial [Thermoanaerobaculia bacterium]|nr:arginine deiminase family protein [Thermoanaerobaculia bacterium]
MIAITRDVAKKIADAELTHMERVSIDYRRAAEQHEQYRDALRSLGVEVLTIPADERHPDCVFIEDTAIVLDDVAVITRPGAESRRGEVDAVAEEVARIRPLVRIEAPATIDGGDVLVLGDRIYVGLSTRTNEEALAQLARLTRREVIAVNVTGALHLKTAITRVSDDTLLVNREWLDVAPFAGWQLIDVDPDEPFAGNALLVGDTLIYPNAFGKTRARLEAAGLTIRGIDADELAKAEGGVTCCCLLAMR